MLNNEEIPQVEGTGSVLDGITPQPTASYVSTKDVTDNRQYLSPSEIDIYNSYQAQNQADPERGALNFQDYYPGYQAPGAVGTYSGSLVGSNSLFGGGAALIPIGMMDARDVAVKKAAMQKQKEVADFRKQFEAPKSKLTNINKNLTDEYLDHVNNGWNTAMKKANGDPNLAKKILEADTEFWKKEKSYKNVALEGDDMKNQIARIDTAVEKGELISSRAKEARDKLLTSLNPNSPDFKEAQRNFAQVNAEIDLSKTFEQALDNAVTSELGTALDKSSPDYNRVLKESIEKLSPETKEAVIRLVQKSKEGSKLYTPEEIEKTGMQLMSYEKKKQDLSISNKPQDDGPSELVPTNSDEANVVNSKALQTQGRSEPLYYADGTPQLDENGNQKYSAPSTTPQYRNAKHSVYDQATFSKPVKTIIPLSALGTDITKGIPNTKSGNVDAEISTIANAKVYTGLTGANAKYNGMMVDDDAPLDDFKKAHVKYQPMVAVQYTYKDADGKTQTGSTWQPLSTVKNALRGKNGRNDKVLKQIEDKAVERSGKKTETKNSSEGKKKDPLGIL